MRCCAVPCEDGAVCCELLTSAHAFSVLWASVDGSTTASLELPGSSAEMAVSMVRGSGMVSSEVSSGVAGCSGGSDLGHSSDSFGSGALSILCAMATVSSSVSGSDMVEEEDISDAVEDGSRGRERRRSFWRLSKAERDQNVFRKSCVH